MKKKTHRIYAREGDAILNGLQTSKGKVEFGNQTAVYVDESTAMEVNERYGGKYGDVIVAKDEQYDRALNGEGWKIQYDSKRGDWVKTIHKWRFQGVDTSRLKEGKPSRFVWVWNGGKQILIPRQQAEEEGYEIVSKKRDNAGEEPEVEYDNGG